MEKFLDISIVSDYKDNKVVNSKPQLINIKNIAKVKTSQYQDCAIIVDYAGIAITVCGTYAEIRERIGNLKSTDTRNCYIFKSGVSTHYVPLDAVSDIRVGDNNVVSVVVKTGDVLYTGMTFVDLRKTIIDINFGG